MLKEFDILHGSFVLQRVRYFRTISHTGNQFVVQTASNILTAGSLIPPQRSTYSNSWIDHLLMQAPMKVIHCSYNCKRFTLVYGTHRRLWWRINLYAPDLANWVIIGSCTHTWSLVRPQTITWTGDDPQQQTSVQFDGNAVVYRNKWFWNCRPHNALFLFQHELVKSVAWTICGNDSEANFPISEIQIYLK